MQPFTQPRSVLTRLVRMCSLLLLFAMQPACSEDHSQSTALEIRIHNQAVDDIDNLWLGAGSRGGATQDTAFGRIDAGEVTAWHQVDAHRDNYRKLNFVVSGRRFNAVVDLPVEDLRPGRYTFVVTMDGEEAVVSVEADAET